MQIPFLRPNPPRLTALNAELALIEASGQFSNFGPFNRKFEAEASHQLFGKTNGCVTISNATLGLMLAIHAVTSNSLAKPKKYALLPSFTFAATAHAALWAGLTPLLSDISPATWLPDEASENALIDQYGDEIAVIVPYATFGNNLDLERYTKLSVDKDIPIVVDAAASLGSSADGRLNFGSGFGHPVVFSMHATKTFATAEGGLIWCENEALREQIRAMANFGFEKPRTASMMGINAKLSEVGALLALAKLKEFESVVSRRNTLASLYQEELGAAVEYQELRGQRVAHQFFPVLLPECVSEKRDRVISHLSAKGIGAAHYFSPHLRQQEYFERICIFGSLETTEGISRRILSLPLSDEMTNDEVKYVSQNLKVAINTV